MALRARADRPGEFPANVTRTAFPELTRCDHCGVLDERTEPVLEFKDACLKDGWYWLHPQCKPLFEPVNNAPQFSPPYTYSTAWWPKSPKPKPPLSNIRARARAKQFDRSAWRVVCCGGKYWCACEPGLRERHLYRWEYFIEINKDGEFKRIMSTKPPHLPSNSPPLRQQPICAYCEKVGNPERPLQFIAICLPGRMDVQNDFLHPDCEKGYLRLLDDPAERR